MRMWLGPHWPQPITPILINANSYIHDQITSTKLQTNSKDKNNNLYLVLRFVYELGLDYWDLQPAHQLWLSRPFDLDNPVPQYPRGDLDVQLLAGAVPHQGLTDGREDRKLVLLVTGLFGRDQHILEILLGIKVFKGDDRPDENFIAGDILILNDPDLGQFGLHLRDTGRVMRLGVFCRVVFRVLGDIPLQA